MIPLQHLAIAVAAKAITATDPAVGRKSLPSAIAEPALNPNQPTIRMAAPIKVQPILWGRNGQWDIHGVLEGSGSKPEQNHRQHVDDGPTCEVQHPFWNNQPLTFHTQWATGS